MIVCANYDIFIVCTIRCQAEVDNVVMGENPVITCLCTLYTYTGWNPKTRAPHAAVSFSSIWISKEAYSLVWHLHLEIETVKLHKISNQVRLFTMPCLWLWTRLIMFLMDFGRKAFKCHSPPFYQLWQRLRMTEYRRPSPFRSQQEKRRLAHFWDWFHIAIQTVMETPERHNCWDHPKTALNRLREFGIRTYRPHRVVIGFIVKHTYTLGESLDPYSLMFTKWTFF